MKTVDVKLVQEYNIVLITKKNLLSLFFIYLFLFFGFISPANAHSGRTDSSGGHNCYVGSCAGTYHYHNGGPAYNPPSTTTNTAPICTRPNLENISGSPQLVKKGCNHTVTFSWDQGVGDNQYSIRLSKVPGADPGPKADTYTTSMTFEDVKPGKWYINLKGGNSCGWSQIYYWEIDVPTVKPTLIVREEVVSEKERRLLIDSECATSVTSDQPLKNLRPGSTSSTIYPTKDTTYTIYANSGNETTFKTIKIKYLLPTPTPNQTPVTSIEPKIPSAEKQGFWSWF